MFRAWFRVDGSFKDAPGRQGLFQVQRFLVESEAEDHIVVWNDVDGPREAVELKARANVDALVRAAKPGTEPKLAFLRMRRWTKEWPYRKAKS
jgi:hypothetical protein